MRETSKLIHREPGALANSRSNQWASSATNAVINGAWRQEPPEELDALRKFQLNYVKERRQHRTTGHGARQQSQPALCVQRPPAALSSAFCQCSDSRWAPPPCSVTTLRAGRQIGSRNSDVYWHLLLQTTGKLSDT